MDGAVAIVLAAGDGDRLGSSMPKAFAPLGARPIVAHSVSTVASIARVGSIVVVAPPGWEERTRAIVGPFGAVSVVTGGSSRQASVRAALSAIPPDAEAIVCHDAARALASANLFGAVLDALDGWDGVVPVVPVADTVKRVRDGSVVRTEPREGLGLAQTPQAFRAPALRDAHARAERDGLQLTDDAGALEHAGYRVRAIDGEPGNFKITTPEDLGRAEAAVKGVVRG